MSLRRGGTFIAAAAIAVLIAMQASMGHSQTAPAGDTGTIQGIVLDGDGNPIVCVSVYALPWDDMLRRRFTTTTDDSGQFTIAGLPSGLVYPHAYNYAAGYPDDFFSFYLEPGAPMTEVTVKAGETIKDVVIRRGPKYARQEFAIFGPDGKPFEAASLDFDRPDIPGPYGSSLGPNMSMLVPPVPFRVTVHEEGYAPWTSQMLELKSGETFHLDVSLTPSP